MTENTLLLLSGDSVSCTPRSAEAAEPAQDIAELKAFFLQHAHFFLHHACKILSESRMLLAPVGLRGKNERMTTLGGMLELWTLGPEEFRTGDPFYMYAGQPPVLSYGFSFGSFFSGDCRCRCVLPSGEQTEVWRGHFAQLYGSMQGALSRYTDEACRYEHYTLQEVYELLKDQPEDSDAEIRQLKARAESARQKRKA